MKAAPPYCGPHGLGLAEAVRAIARRERHWQSWGPFDGRRAVLTHCARTGIALACRLWGLGRDDEALVPAYNCGSEVDVLLRLGLRVRLYRVACDTRIDQDQVRALCGPRTRLVLVIHYFGWPQHVHGLAQWCQQRGTYLLEDCALALFSAGPDGYVGRCGDAAVFSLPKTLPVPDGGVLSLPMETRHDLGRLRPPPWRPLLRRTLPLLKARAMRTAETLGLYPLARRLFGRSWLREHVASNGAPFPDMPASYYFDERLVQRGISRLTAGLLTHVDPVAVKAARRRNYVQLQQGLSGRLGVCPLLGELPTDVCPLAFPVVVPDRSRWLAALHARGVPAVGWWAGYHGRLSWDGFAEAHALKTQVVALPVHQDITEARIDYIVRCIRDIER